jgi:hypothetical protein
MSELSVNITIASRFVNGKAANTVKNLAAASSAGETGKTRKDRQSSRTRLKASATTFRIGK